MEILLLKEPAAGQCSGCIELFSLAQIDKLYHEF